MLRAVLREPLLHFLAAGAVIFMMFSSTGNRSEQQGNKIVVTSGKIDQMVTIFSRTWQRHPTPQELDSLIEEDIRDEVLYREAVEMGLDKNDSLVRRNMRQKIEFITEDSAAISLPTEGDLQNWLDQHADKFRLAPRFTFEQVFLNSGHRGEGASVEARRLLVRLNNPAEKPNISELGDPTMLPQNVSLASFDDIASIFGDDFARQLVQLQSGAWNGPLTSSYGVHLVRLLERTESRKTTLGESRDEVQREWVAARRAEAIETLYRKLRGKYVIAIEPSQPDGIGQPIVQSPGIPGR